MNLKRKLMTSLMTMGLVSALVGGATFAIFTDDSSNTANTFTAGTVVVTAGAQEYSLEGNSITNMAPGDTVTGSFTVTNDGTLDLRFDTTAATAGDLFGGTTPATVTIDNPTDVVLAPGGSANITYSVTLPLGAGNTYQGATGDLTFTVNAEQTKNNPVAE